MRLGLASKRPLAIILRTDNLGDVSWSEQVLANPCQGPSCSAHPCPGPTCQRTQNNYYTPYTNPQSIIWDEAT